MSGLLAGWIPTPPDGADPTDVRRAADFTRATVDAAEPRTKKEAATAARYVFDYVYDVLVAGQPLEPALFEVGAVETWMDKTYADGKKGSKAARQSYLKRMTPGIGLAGSTRPNAKPAGATPEQPSAADTPADDPAPEPLVIPVVEQYIAGWVPAAVPAEMWTPIAAVVRDAVRMASPHTTGQAAFLLRAGAYLAARHETEGLPTTPNVLFSKPSVDRFAKTIKPRVSASYFDTIISSLEELCDAVQGQRCGQAARLRRSTRPVPYSEDEVQYTLRHIRNIRSDKRRRHAESAIRLTAGAGATPSECAWTRPEDITAEDEAVWVVLFKPHRYDTGGEYALAVASGLAAIHPDDTETAEIAGTARKVKIAVEHADRLLELARLAAAHGEPWMIGGNGASRGKRLSTLMATHSPAAIDFDSTRARYHFALNALRTEPSLSAAAAAADMNPEILAELLPYAIAQHPSAPYVTKRIAARGSDDE